MNLESMKKKPHEMEQVSYISPEFEGVLLRILRTKSIGEKLQIVSRLNNIRRLRMLSEIALNHPEFTEQQQHRKLLDLLLGEKLAETVYGPANCEISSSQESKLPPTFAIYWNAHLKRTSRVDQ